MGLRSKKRLAPRAEAIAKQAARLICVGVVAAVAGICVLGCGDRLEEARSLEATGDLTGAIAAYEMVLAEDAEDVAALSGKAVCLIRLGRYDEALPLQERVVALDSADVLTRVELGFNYLGHQGRPADAVRMLGEAVGLEPSAKNLTFLAQAQVAWGDYEGAESTLRQAVEAEPDYGHAYSKLIDLLEELGRGEDADEVREEALDRGIVITDSE